MLKKFAIGLSLLILVVWARNASFLVRATPSEDAQWIAHRGVHQTYPRAGLTNDTCTAERIYPPTHALLENTIASLKAAFEAGAAVVELDVHPTTDGHLVVWHDWTVDCRTDGTGVTRQHDLASLRRLDIGYGYTADGGETFPFRGKDYGPMPTLPEVFEALPDGRFLINFKSRDAADGVMLAELLQRHPDWVAQVWGVYGAPPPVEAVKRAFPDLNDLTRAQLKSCALDYMLTGWTGRVPTSCRDTTLMIPISHRRVVWGWPKALMARMDAVGTTVILSGSYSSGDPGTSGIDTDEWARRVPPDFSGYLWTNKIEVMGPNTD